MNTNPHLQQLTEHDYTLASELWYDAELLLKQCVEAGDSEGALKAYTQLEKAVYQRFEPILSPLELTSTLLGIIGGILHFACRDAGLPPAYLTMMIVWQKETLLSSFQHQHVEVGVKKCITYACDLVNSFSLPEYGPLIKKAITYIHHHLSENISIDTLASSLHVTRQYLSTKFHDETNSTITTYINKQRIQLSKHYLQNNRYTITQIAMLCGYMDSNYYGRVFKSIEHITPKEYRRQYTAIYKEKGMILDR